MSETLPARVVDIWVYLAASPLLWLTATLAVYALADWIAARAGRHPLVNAVAISVSVRRCTTNIR